MRKLFVLLVLIVISVIPCFGQVVGDTLEFTIEKVTEAVRYRSDNTVYDTVTVKLRHEFFRREVGNTDSTYFAMIDEEDSALIVPDFPIGTWEIGYRGLNDTVLPGKIFWSNEQESPWVLEYKDVVLIQIAKQGTFIGFRLIRRIK